MQNNATESIHRLFWTLQVGLTCSQKRVFLETLSSQVHSNVNSLFSTPVPSSQQILLELMIKAEAKAKKHAQMIDTAEVIILPELVDDYGKDLTAGCPFALHVRGPRMGIGKPSIALIGSRHPTLEGRRMTAQISQALSKSGYFIWSGGAIGIDTTAIKAALNPFKIEDSSFDATHTHADSKCHDRHKQIDFAGCGVVLGSGLECPYPPSNKELFANKNLTLVSEFPSHLRAKPYCFPSRNFTLSWLADYVLIIESQKNSGSLITAHCAAHLGKGVGALEWPESHSLASGNNSLIENGADKIQNIQHLLNHLQSSIPSPTQKNCVKDKNLKKHNQLRHWIKIFDHEANRSSTN